MDIVIPMNSESTRVPYVPPSGSAPVATKPAKRKSGSLKTVLTVLLGLAAIVVLALPYAHGALAKRVSSELLKASNENNQFSKIELVNYSGGYASSQATYKLILSADVAKISSGEYTFNCNTKHKITGYRQNCRLGNAGYLEWLEENLNGKDPFTTTLKGSLFGKFGTELEVTPFEVKSEDGEIMSMGAAKIVTDVKAITGSAMRFQGQADGLTFKDSETDIVLGGATLEGDLESDGVLAFGFGNVLIDSIKMSDAEENVVMKKVSFVYELR